MENHGWIKLHRKISDNAFCAGNSERLGFWINLLMLANHKPNTFFLGRQLVAVKEGQFVTGRHQLSKITGVSEMKLERWLTYMENAQQIEQQKTNKYRVITICNWSSYQQDVHQNAQQMNNKRTTDEQQMNTNNNDKNEKNDKNEIIQHTTIQGIELSKIESPKELKRPDTLTDHSVSHYVIELFRDLNPDVARLHKLKGEADAALILYRNAVKGNLDQLERAIAAIPEIAGDVYSPKDIKSISKPSQLLTHWALYCAQAKGRSEKIKSSGPHIL